VTEKRHSDTQMLSEDRDRDRQRQRQREKETESGMHSSLTSLGIGTASIDQSNHDECVAVGMNDFLGKPFTKQQLLACIARWTGRDPIAPTSPMITAVNSNPLN
jgi:CheY-like chemotaxis protein